MTPDLSLEASAQAYLKCGMEQDAAMCRRMARACRSLGMIGPPLYRFWAAEQAERAAIKAMQTEGEKDGG